MAPIIDLDNHLRKCITIITSCIVLVACAFAAVIVFVTFSGEEGLQKDMAKMDRVLELLGDLEGNINSGKWTGI